MSISEKTRKMLNRMNPASFATKLGDLLKELYDGSVGVFDDRLDDLEVVVGNEDAGMVKDVADLKTVVGNAASGAIKDIDDIQAAIGKFATKALVAEDIAAGVATIDTGVDFCTWYSVSVCTAAGAPRTITAVAKGTGAGNTTKILITATDVAATDIVSVIVK